jgi:hypothetical protein
MVEVMAGPGAKAATPEAITEPASEVPGWHAQARQALEAWPHARSAGEKLALLEVLATLADAHPLVLAPLTQELDSADPVVRARLLVILDNAGVAAVTAAARSAILHADPELAVTAAQMLARRAPPGVRDDLVAVWRQPVPPSAAVTDAVIDALSHAVPAGALVALRTDEVPGIRAAALDALRRQHSGFCREFLGDATLADAAAAAIYDERIESAWPALAVAGTRAENTLSPAARERAIAAAWHLGGADEADRLAAWIAAQPPAPDAATTDPAVRAAWRALLEWDSPRDQDPVLPDRPFHAHARPAAQHWPALERHTSALAAWAQALGPEASTTWNAWLAQHARAPATTKDFILFLENPAIAQGERLHHFKARVSQSREMPALTEIATSALAVADAPTVRAAARAWLFRQRGAGAVAWLLQSLAQATAFEKQDAIRLLDQHASPEAQTYLLRLLDQARLGLVDTAVVPELVEGIERRARAQGPETRGLRAALDAWRATQPPSLGDPLRPWRAALQPGDSVAGRTIFFSDATGCSSCHRSSTHAAENAPLPQGPPLQGVGSRLDGPALLEAVVLPAGPPTRGITSAPIHGGCRPAGTLLTLRELRDLLTYLRALP